MQNIKGVKYCVITDTLNLWIHLPVPASIIINNKIGENHEILWKPVINQEKKPKAKNHESIENLQINSYL